MNYLLPAEYELYGLETDTPEPWIGAASKMIDATCRRPTLQPASYTERFRISAGRNNVQLTFLPLVTVPPATRAIVAARVRYSPGAVRRGDDTAQMAGDVSLAFQLPGAWIDLDPATVDVDPLTGETVLPTNIWSLAYSEAEVTYTAGLSTIPDEVKFACVQIVKNAQATPALNVKSGKLDGLKLEYFSGTLVDESVKKLIAPYVAQKVA
jgi:hypothetical protein